MKYNLSKMQFLSFKQSAWLITLMLILVSASLTFSSCKKGETTNVSTDNYYVKYIITGNGAYGRFSDWTVTTPQGSYTNNGYQTISWNKTYGPVKQGFKCNVQIGSYIGGTPTIEIHVAKNAEAFALKVTNTGNSATYTIN